MASIGITQCTFIHGLPVPPSPRVRVFTAEGTYGYGKIIIGVDPGHFSLNAVHYMVKSGVCAWLLQLASIVGQTTYITVDTGFTIYGATIQQLGKPTITPAHYPGIIGRVRVEVPFQGVFQ